MGNLTALREEILQKVAAYVTSEQRGRDGSFVPGKSRISCAGRCYDAQEVVALVDSALEFYLTASRFTEKFERELARFLGVEHALMTNSGSSANLLAVAALAAPELGFRRLAPGCEVITTACAFPTTVSPMIQLGAVPVFVDVTRATANINCDQLEAALSPKTRAVMVAHTLGNPFNLARVKAFCNRHHLWLVEDNCDALGSEFAGRKTGSWGDISTCSFYPAHHITTGEGGAVCTSNPLLAKVLRSLRDWGRSCACPTGADNFCGRRFEGHFGSLPEGYDHKYVYSRLGYNLKATDLQAAIGTAQLEKLPEFVKKRKANFRRLEEQLSMLPQLFGLEKLADADPAWFGFLVSLEPASGSARADLAAHLEKRNIQTRPLFAGNLIRHPAFSDLKTGIDYRVAAPLTDTDFLMNNSLWVGVHPNLTSDEIDYVALSIKEFCSCRGAR